MKITNQPQIRVIDPESDYYGVVLDVVVIHHDSEKVEAEDDIIYTMFGFDQIQELTPLSFEGTRIGVGDEVKAEDGADGKVLDYVNHEYDPAIWVEGMSMKLTWQNITDHTPLTEMKKEDNDRPINEPWDSIEGVLHDVKAGAMDISEALDEIRKRTTPHVSNSENTIVNDKPTIEKIDENIYNTPKARPELQKLCWKLDETLEALADAGIINLKDNQE